MHIKFFTEVIFDGSMHMPINCADRAIEFHYCTSRSILNYVPGRLNTRIHPNSSLLLVIVQLSQLVIDINV